MPSYSPEKVSIYASFWYQQTRTARDTMKPDRCDRRGRRGLIIPVTLCWNTGCNMADANGNQGCRLITSSSVRARQVRCWLTRLSEDGRHSVLVLEYGGTDIGPLIQMPAAFSYPMNMKRYDWGYRDRSRAPSRRQAARLSAG